MGICNTKSCAFCDGKDCRLYSPVFPDPASCRNYITKCDMNGMRVYVVFGYEEEEGKARGVPFKVFFNKEDAEEYAKWVGNSSAYVEEAVFSDGTDYAKVIKYCAAVWFSINGDVSYMTVHEYRNDRPGHCDYVNTIERCFSPDRYVVKCSQEFDHDVDEKETRRMIMKRGEKIRDYVLENLGKKSFDEIQEEIRGMK